MVKMTGLAKRVVAFRILFGVIWAIDAVMKWLPGFRQTFVMDIMDAAGGQPSWLNWWFNFWMNPMMNHGQLFAYITAILETLIAAALLLGFARKSTYIVAAVFSFLIWSIGEGFGGPYASGATDIGAGIMYVVLFGVLYQLEKAVPNSWSLDAFIAKKITWWQAIAKP